MQRISKIIYAYTIYDKFNIRERKNTNTNTTIQYIYIYKLIFCIKYIYIAKNV
jgi:hypothetical protein